MDPARRVATRLAYLHSFRLACAVPRERHGLYDVCVARGWLRRHVGRTAATAIRHLIPLPRYFNRTPPGHFSLPRLAWGVTHVPLLSPASLAVHLRLRNQGARG